MRGGVTDTHACNLIEISLPLSVFELEDPVWLCRLYSGGLSSSCPRSGGGQLLIGYLTAPLLDNQ